MRVLSSFQHLLLIGMPNAGKTYIGHYLSTLYNIPHYDMNQETKSYLPQNESSLLEWYFYRKQEYQFLSRQLQSSTPSIISLGDGCIEYAPVYHLLYNQNVSFIIHVIPSQQNPETIPLWMKRAKYYFSISDIDYWNDRVSSPQSLLSEIKQELDKNKEN